MPPQPHTDNTASPSAPIRTLPMSYLQGSIFLPDRPHPACENGTEKRPYVFRFHIPYSDGKKFTLSATTIVSKSGKQIPLMECGASYEDFLNGLDENAVQELIDKAMISGAYPGLKIGDITTDNNNAGNW
mgnify:CR=1 FL=1